ncbi:MAG TPA: vgr related protein [Sphingomicrobium sp.]|nr:vgr related protein [Sphingomicrobium sp.]
MESRALTAGEIALSRTIFEDAIDYSTVRLIKGKWWPFQPGNAAMSPNGNIYFHPKAGGWSEDFSREMLARQGFFIHEMTHVWQAQRGGSLYLPLMRHPFCRYSYDLKPGKPFCRYGLEQQAEIVRHRFLADRGVAIWPNPLPGLLPFGRTARHG